MEPRPMTIADHREIECEGWRSPAQIPDDTPSAIDLQLAQCETLFVRKLVASYLRRIDDRLAHISAGRITPMPAMQDGLPAYLQLPKG